MIMDISSNYNLADTKHVHQVYSHEHRLSYLQLQHIAAVIMCSFIVGIVVLSTSASSLLESLAG